MIHQGEILEKVLRRKKINFVQLAKMIGVTKPTIYNWFDTVTHPTDRLEKIGKSINYDFSADIPSMNNPYREPSTRINPQKVEPDIYQTNEVTITIKLTGDESRLNAIIRQLKKLNEAMKSE
ncbi:MAG: helix-turn-helix transcriptional regulator [Rhodonellum sp.]|nr:helix-turn-helix transcriptional regulator [Rhodonellum sp.]